MGMFLGYLRGKVLLFKLLIINYKKIDFASCIYTISYNIKKMKINYYKIIKLKF
jgi:hypothetical protein